MVQITSQPLANQPGTQLATAARDPGSGPGAAATRSTPAVGTMIRTDAVRPGAALSRSAEALFQARLAGDARMPSGRLSVGPPPAFEVSVLDDLRATLRAPDPEDVPPAEAGVPGRVPGETDARAVPAADRVADAAAAMQDQMAPRSVGAGLSDEVAAAGAPGHGTAEPLRHSVTEPETRFDPALPATETGATPGVRGATDTADTNANQNPLRAGSDAAPVPVVPPRVDLSL